MPLALVETAETPLTLSRQELARLHPQLAAAKAEVDRLRQPVDRLNAAIFAHDRAKAELARQQTAHLEVLGEWVAAVGVGDPPQPSEQLLQAKRLVEDTRAAAQAAEQRIPGAEAEAQASSQALVALGHLARSARLRVTLEEHETELGDKELRPAIDRVMRLEAKLKGFEQYLWELGRRENDGEAMAIAGRVVDLLNRLRPSVIPPPDPRPAASLLARLAHDPTAKLEIE